MLSYILRTLLLFSATLPLPASTFYFNGNFVHDDDMRRFQFTIVAPSTITLQTWSYGGPTDPLTSDPLFGGFAPVLSVFDSAGNLAGGPDSGGVNGGSPGCGTRGIDPGTNFCLDGFIQEPLGPGSYFLILTEYDNLPSGTHLSDGFDRTGQGNFTGTAFGPGSGKLYDLNGNQRTGKYVLTLDGVVSAQQISAVPEPSTLLLTVCGLAGGAIRLRKRRKSGFFS